MPFLLVSSDLLRGIGVNAEFLSDMDRPIDQARHLLTVKEVGALVEQVAAVFPPIQFHL